MTRKRTWLVGPVLAVAMLAAPCAWATLPPVTNFAKVQTSVGYTSAATSIILLSGQGAKLPATFPFPVIWWNCTDFGAPEDDAFVEIVSVTARSVDTLTVVRAQESTIASNHNTGGKTYCMVLAITKGMWDAIRTDIAAASGGSSLVKSGINTPEGAVTAGVGELYLRTNGASNTTLYTKESGTGNTGWAPVLTVTPWSSPGTIGTTTSNSGYFTALLAREWYTTPNYPSYGVNVTIDASLGIRQIITVTDAIPFNILTPTNSADWQNMSITIQNTSGGIMGLPTWDIQYKMATFTKPENGFQRTVTFSRLGTNWYELNCSPQVPN